MKSKIKPVALGVFLMTANATYATGIPVVDTAQIAQDAANFVQELTKMVEQINTAKKQLTELKAQVKAMTGVKGFSDVLTSGGLDDEVLGSFEDLLNGTSTTISDKNKGLVGDVDCSSETSDTDKMLCESSALGLASSLDNIEKLSSQFNEKLSRITELSQRIKSANDVKSMSEIQAAITLESNSLAVLEQQRLAFKDLQETRERLYTKRVLDEQSNKMLEKMKAEKTKSADYGDLLN